LVVLFPDVADYVKKQNYCQNAYYLGNVINSFPVTMQERVIEKKWKNKKIIFIGAPKYMEGLKVLVEALQNVQSIVEGVTLDVIGMTSKQFSGECPENVTFHGYLDKSNPSQMKEYYDIVDGATVFVNTTPRWSSFSASLDVMYHYTPIIISRYRSFELTFGSNIDFGDYCNNSVNELTKNIEDVFTLSLQEYSKLTENARESVEPFSWSHYVNGFLRVMKRFDK